MTVPPRPQKARDFSGKDSAVREIKCESPPIRSHPAQAPKQPTAYVSSFSPDVACFQPSFPKIKPNDSPAEPLCGVEQLPATLGNRREISAMDEANTPHFGAESVGRRYWRVPNQRLRVECRPQKSSGESPRTRDWSSRWEKGSTRSNKTAQYW